jgi:hypothetical protein
MTGPEIHHPATRAEWLTLRQGFTGCSEVAALVNCHPWMTVAQLWARKSGRLDPEPENSAMRRGKYLEAVALTMLADEHPDWTIRPNPIPGGNFLTDAESRLCATPDAYATVPGDDSRLGMGIIQVKSVEPRSFKREWINAEGDIEPPLHVTIQTLMEMHLTGCEWGVVAALVVDSGIALHVLPVPHIPGLVERLVEANLDFWQHITTGVRPPLDYGRDLDLIARLNPAQSDKTLDLSGDNEFIHAVNEHASCAHDIGLLIKRKARSEAIIRDKLGDASGAEAGDWFVSSRVVNRSAYQIAATSYRQLKVRYRGAVA